MAYQKGLQFFFFKRQIIQCIHGLKAKIKRILNMVSCVFRYVEVKSINKLSLIGTLNTGWREYLERTGLTGCS